MTNEQVVREIARWLHEKLCCAQNLPWEEGDICDDCLESVKAEVLPLLARVRLETAIKVNTMPCGEYDDGSIANYIGELEQAAASKEAGGGHGKA